MEKYKAREITEKIIGATYKVHNTFGSGFFLKNLKATGRSVSIKRGIMDKNKCRVEPIAHLFFEVIAPRLL